MMEQVASLAEITNLITDGKHGDCADEFDSGYFFISAKDVKDGKISYEGARQITKADFEDTHRRTRLEPDDIIITNSGTIGRMAIVQDSELTRRTTFQKSVAIIKPKKSVVEPKFLYYTFLAQVGYLIELSGGTAQKNLLLGDLRRFKLKLPHVKTQKKIAAVLSAYDELIANNRRRIALLEKMAEEIYREWFVRLRFPGHEKVKVIKGVPEGWEIKMLGSILELCYGKALKDDDRIPGEFLVYGSSGVVGTHNEALVKKPGLIVGRKGNVGSVYWSDRGFFPIDTVYFVKSELPNSFLYFLLRSMNFINNDSAVPGLNRNQAYSNLFFLPPVPLINKYAEVADSQFEMKQILTRQNENLIAARDRLLPRLISGKLSVENLDIQFPPGMEEPAHEH